MLKSWKDHSWAGVPVMRARIEETVKEVNGRGKTVLEIGCNEGFLSKALIEDGCIVTSADLSDEMIINAQRLFGIDAIKADINNLPFEDRSFDIAVSGETIEHVENPFKALCELFRVAKEKVIISIPVGEYWLGELTHQWEIGVKIIEHEKGDISTYNKHILLMTWTKRRDEKNNDIPPFSTKVIKDKYSI